MESGILKKKITQKVALLGTRFGVTIALLVGFAILLFDTIHGQDGFFPPIQLFVFLPIGALIAAVTILGIENFVRNRIMQNAIALAVVALWGWYCYFLPYNMFDDHVGKNIDILAIGATAFFALFFISFLKKNQDIAFWNFTTRMILNLGLSIFFGAIFFGGLSAAILAVDQLFEMTTMDDVVYGYLAIFCFVLLVPIYFLANIPDKTDKYNDALMVETKYLKILPFYILLPIVAIYLVILYAYLFKIVMHWELPNGGVSWLMSAIALGGLVIITLLYPVRLQEKSKLTEFISRYFGLLILPLLILMSIGIYYRINEYGITINRAYMLLLNAWFYGIYLYLTLVKSRHIKWILISAVGVVLLSSVGTWNIPNTTKRILTAELNQSFQHQKISLSDTAFFAEMDLQEKMQIKSKLEYLIKAYGLESIQPFFAEKLEYYEVRNLLEESLETAIPPVVEEEMEFVVEE